ncbi:MAG: hypothetical protein ACR2O6_11955 [Ilumatobacteraceae bacterium]
MSWRGARTAVFISAAALALAACPDDDGGSSEDVVAEPSVFIDVPDSSEVIVREPSFEIGGGLGGSVTTITVAIDGGSVGPATRADNVDEWRFGASRFSIAPGLHEITVTATGDGGTANDSLWIYYEPDAATMFQLAVVPDAATYPSDEGFPDDPRLLIFGPGFGDQITLDLTAESPPEIRATTNPRLSTGSLASLDVDFDDPPPGTYPIVVRGVSDSGEAHEATHTVTITGPPPPTDPPPATEPPTEPSTVARTVVLADDFEGADLWTATVTASTNGSQASAELAGGGNPGGHRRMAHVLPGTDDGENNPTQVTVHHIFTGGGWDPATDGPLARINYAEDQIEYEPPFEGAAIGALFLVVQDGTTYSATINENNAYTNTTWQTTRVDGLTPADFSPEPGPDFSAGGAPMTFGYLRANTSRSGGAGIVTQHGIDNWAVELIGAGS